MKNCMVQELHKGTAVKVMGTVSISLFDLYLVG